MTMKHTVFNITVILFLFSAAVQAQSPGGVAGPVKWATGKDNGTVQLSGTGGMTFVGEAGYSRGASSCSGMSARVPARPVVYRPRHAPPTLPEELS